MDNNTFDPDAQDNLNIKFEMKIAISAREAMSVSIDIGGSPYKTVQVEANKTYILDIDRDYAKQIYLLTSEKDGYKGVHVYSASNNKDKSFSCFLYNRTGETGGSSRDASLVLPTRFLGKEYVIQTAPEDYLSSEFAIVATEPTTVKIKPTFETFNGKAAGNEFQISLSKGQAYLIASKQHEGEEDFNEDLSGTTICADKPIAVFNGNQQTSFPVDEARTRDMVIEQALPLEYWGKDFYVSLLDTTRNNSFIITAGPEGANVTILGYDASTGTSSSEDLPLGAFGSSDPINISAEFSEMVIHSDKPIMCYDYLTSGMENTFKIGTGSQALTVYYCDPGNAMLPAWKHRVNEMNFFTYDLDPMKSGNKNYPQTYYVYLVAPKEDAQQGKITVDGQTVPFTPFHEDDEMAYASYWITNPESHYHSVTSTGKGFIGMVYGISYVQGYFYTLGYNPNPDHDSLFINNTEALMSAKSYDMDSLDGHGWYQRQWNEWVEGKERLDTAVVCDSSFVYWTLETAEGKNISSIDWNLYNVTDGERKPISHADFPQGETPTDAIIHKQHQFILPPEPMDDNRHQFFEYELEIILHRPQLLCGGDEPDTLRTVTRVTRIFNDTVWRAICVGDTLKFFYDSLYNQGDLNQHKTGVKKATQFAAIKSDADAVEGEWIWNVKPDPGKYSFTRRYVSQFGCDSVITLELFVCDTFRFVDTVHLCSNQDTLYHGRLYRGYDYTGDRATHPYRWVYQDTTVWEERFKTKHCDCQEDDNEWKDKYKDKWGINKFTGCDSIYELHLVIHKSYEVKVTDTLDYHEFPDSIYRWKIERDGIQRDSLITKYSPGVEWNESAQAWIGYFGDTIRTKTCDECNGGNPKGCDSINSLKLIIPPVYKFKEDTVWCRIHYDWNRHDTTFRDFQWEGHSFGRDHDTVYTVGGVYYDSCVSRYGADSIYRLHLVYSSAAEPLYNLVKDTVCRDTAEGFNKYTWKSTDDKHLVYVDTIPKDKPGYFYYVNEDLCDSIFALELLVLPTYFKSDTARITEEQTYKWYFNDSTYGGVKTTQHYDSLITTPITILVRNPGTDSIGIHSCDSIHELVLYIGEVYRDTIDTFVCGQAEYYDWMGIDHDGNDSLRMRIYNLPPEGEKWLYEDEYKTVLGYDSIFYLNLYRALTHDSIDSIRVCQAPGATFEWPNHGAGHHIYDMDGNLVTSIPADKYGYYEYVDTIPTTYYGCDSVWHLHLYVDSVYAQEFSDKACQTREYIWPDQDPDSIFDSHDNPVKPIPTEHIGDYTYFAKYHTIYGCDSIWTLHLHIDTIYSVAVTVTDTFMCDKDSLVFLDRTIYGSKSPNKPADVLPENVVTIPEDAEFAEKDLEGFVPSSLGCDSAVMYHLVVYKTYSDTVYMRACQPSEGRDSLFHWLNHDTVWDVHNQRYIPADSIPRYVKGDTTYLYIDSLRTTTCSRCDNVRGGCDSLFYLYLTIDSTYHYYDTAQICQDGRHMWQGLSIAGNAVEDLDPLHDTIRKPGVYDFRIAQPSSRCDSIFYLHLTVDSVYHTKFSPIFCDSETAEEAHIYTFTDSHGYNIVENVEFAPHDAVPEADTAITHYEIIHKQLVHHMQSVSGCDSTVTVDITIKPTYLFYHREAICHRGVYEWRGQSCSVSGTYYDSYTTKDGCDSIFVLELFIKPVHVTVIFDTICDNETYWFRDTLRYTDPFGRPQEIIKDYPVWSPGDQRPVYPGYIETTVKSAPPDECDSLIYRYYLEICNTYRYDTVETICSGQPYECTFEDGDKLVTHIWETTKFEYDTGVYVPAFDSTFVDTFYTARGCDSLFYLHAHVLPAYRHIVYDTICANESYTFRDHVIVPTEAKDTIIRDTLPTEYGCDSIFELQLVINKIYIDEREGTMCENGWYEWYRPVISGLEAGDYHFADTLPTEHGCDSIFNLHLIVFDTVHTIRFDTICYNDTLVVATHRYTEAGTYVDTAQTWQGCDSIIFTNLELIPPTIPTIWAEDPMCQGETAFDLYYTYTNHKPISYSLYFDSVGRSMGFEDMEDVAITEYTDPMVITVPIPYADPNDPTTYPKPDIYSVRLVLDNGICMHKETDCIHDSTFMMSYPQWITEQRHGDVIAILNEQFNGGYNWSQFQWYHGETLLVGETKPYLYVPTGLIVGDQYHVQLVRDGEVDEFPTCPVTITIDPIINNYAPTMGYLSVTPTCVHVGHPYITILSRKDGSYRITTSGGSLVSQGVFRADATEVEVPAAYGMYIVQLWSNDTPEEPYRAIKIIVSDKCETCATSSF